MNEMIVQLSRVVPEGDLCEEGQFAMYLSRDNAVVEMVGQHLNGVIHEKVTIPQT